MGLDFSQPLLYTLSLKTRTTRPALTEQKACATTKEEDRKWNLSGGVYLYPLAGNTEECPEGRLPLKR